jgi:hypothetical protein
MKHFTIKHIYCAVFLGIFLIQPLMAQVGIATTTPRGALDIGSNAYGIVYPRVALTANNVQAPVVNPNGGSIVAGTMVYNTTQTTNAANNVYPGIYAWNGSIWAPQFIMEEYKKYSQTGGCQRTTIRESNANPNPNDDEDIAGLTNQTFTPKYSGTYKVEVRANFGAGELIDFTNLDAISLATSEGSFFFRMSGAGVDIDPTTSSYDYTEGWLYTHSYSTHNSNTAPAQQDNTKLHNSALVYHLYLVGGTPYTFNFSICIMTGHSYFLNNGDSGNGQGHVGHDRPCTVEFTFLKEN